MSSGRTKAQIILTEAPRSESSFFALRLGDRLSAVDSAGLLLSLIPDPKYRSTSSPKYRASQGRVSIG